MVYIQDMQEKLKEIRENYEFIRGKGFRKTVFSRAKRSTPIYEMGLNESTNLYESTFEIEQKRKLHSNLEELPGLKKEAIVSLAGALITLPPLFLFVKMGLDSYNNGDIIQGTGYIALSFLGYNIGNRQFKQAIKCLEKRLTKAEENKKIIKRFQHG